MTTHDDDLDHPDDLEDDLPDGEVDLFVLFAEALDPNTDVTIEEAQADWEAVL